ncbi:MAG: restriction endonuclease [Candidatus Accumulibacter sp.]|jgi:hypothetical protein|nr:restriction endonuclease [Accumulibacter sp.]
MQGQLFTQDFLLRGIRETPPYEAFDAAAFARFRAGLEDIFRGVTADSVLNESQTEERLIDRTLAALGWEDASLPQVNMSDKGREDVPDRLLFPDAAAFGKASAENSDPRRYSHGVAILEAKRWRRPLDRGNAAEYARDPDAPSSQMLRYLSRVDAISDCRIKWGILTNGAVWRLYWQNARSRSEEFFEIDLAAALGVPGVQRELDDPKPEHALRLLYLLFGREAFLPQEWDAARRGFHAIARDESRLYEETVSRNLGARVFDDIFLRLADALANGDPEKESDGKQGHSRRYLEELREATLILLYRLLFLFYAEDRNLLPIRDERYLTYSVRRLREYIRDGVDAGKVFSGRATAIWNELKNVFQIVDSGDDSIGMPAYDGGLFDAALAPLLLRARIGDAALAPILDALSRRTEEVTRAWINYRDLSVSHLGGIYERLLEYKLEEEDGRLVVRPASFARKTSGSFYTHDDLVRLLLKESVGRLASEARDEFAGHLEKLRRKASLNPAEWERLDRLDPAGRLIGLAVCDPAMGSGHFLVSLVDTLADLILEAIAEAGRRVAGQPWAAHLIEQNRPWQSPLIARIAAIRQSIRKNAAEHGWTVTDAQLDDRHIVRRMILKKCVFGVDKNPMAVELAKTALWLHTFTVGAPLSFLDPHLRCGDSLHGEELARVRRELSEFGALFQEGEMTRLAVAAQSLLDVGNLTDADISEIELSIKLSREAEREIAPIAALLDFWRAMRWLVPGWPVLNGHGRRGAAKSLDRIAVGELLSGRHDLLAALLAGRIEGEGAAIEAANALLERARALARSENFFHWQTSFPDVFSRTNPGFDALIGNPPWDKIKLQQVEWFAERNPEIARQERAADRKAMIAELEKREKPLWREYRKAAGRADANARVLAQSDDFPLLGGGDVNLYSLFVERAQNLVKPDGIVALLTPSGIAADKGAAEFFRSVSTTGRLAALFDFENRQNPDGSYFPDVDSRFKFSAFVFGGERREFAASRCAFFLHDLNELEDEGRPEAERRVLTLSPGDFRRVNPNTGTAPIFRTRRDANITLRIYREHPVFVDRSEGAEKAVWPVKYVTMFHMTNDSSLFKKRKELETEGFKPAQCNRWKKRGNEALPLYEGKMVQMYDHRAADVVVNTEKLHRPAQRESIPAKIKEQPDRYPVPQYFVDADETHANPYEWALGFKEITAPTNARTMIATVLPRAGFGNKIPILVPQDVSSQKAAEDTALLLANLNSFVFDFVIRQKLQGQTINLYILEQLPVIAPGAFEEKIGGVKIADFIRGQVLRLSYTAHDLAPFARDLGFDGEPFRWDEADRRRRMAALDALFFHLYGLDAGDATYILDSFPIVREQDEAAFGDYRTRALILDALEKIRAGRLPEA